MELPTTTGKHRGQEGFTLAAVLVIMTLMMIIVAYTVPRAWSTIVRRDREMQTIFIMRQIAKAIDAFEAKNHALPVSLDQLKDARQPRFLRWKEIPPDPLTGQVDWLIVTQASGTRPVPAPGAPPPPTNTAPPGIPMKDYAGGPFIGIRPNKNGNSLVILNQADHYEQWSYTVLDFRNDRAARLAAAVKTWQ
jgi:type II secretory pathway pseudopilin PulG